MPNAETVIDKQYMIEWMSLNHQQCWANGILRVLSQTI